MFDDKNDARWPTLVAGLILLIVLAAVAAMSAGLGAGAETTGASGAITLRTHTAAPQRLIPRAHDGVMERLLGSLGPIEEPMAACLGDGALIAYDLGVAPAAAFEVLDQLLESTAPAENEPLHVRDPAASIASRTHCSRSAIRSVRPPAMAAVSSS